MPNVLVVAEIPDGSGLKPVQELLTLARRLGEPAVMALGAGAAGAAEALGHFGASHIFLTESYRYASASTVAPFDYVAHRIVGPSGKVGGLAHHPGLPVDDAGNADAGTDKAAAAAILFGQAVNGVAHFADDVVAAESDFDAQRDFLKKLAVGADGCDAQVGAAEIDSDGKIRHDGEEYQKIIVD